MSGKACEERTQTRFLLDSGKTGPVDPVFFCQKPSLDLYGLFEPKTNPLDHSIQKIRVLLDRMYSPFLFSFIVFIGDMMAVGWGKTHQKFRACPQLTFI